MIKTNLAIAALITTITFMACQQQKKQAESTSTITQQHSIEVVEDAPKKINLTEADLASKKDLV